MAFSPSHNTVRSQETSIEEQELTSLWRKRDPPLSSTHALPLPPPSAPPLFGRSEAPIGSFPPRPVASGLPIGRRRRPSLGVSVSRRDEGGGGETERVRLREQ